MRDFSTMSDKDIYAFLEGEGFPRRSVERLIDDFMAGGQALADAIKTQGAEWRDNFMREWAGCFRHARFTNTISPAINELVFRRHPGLRKLKRDRRGPDLFS
jgi:hypothetical protein